MVRAGAAIPELVGGHPALDLVNTVSWRLDEHRRHDNLTDSASLISWCIRAGVVDGQTAAALTEAAVVDERGPGQLPVLAARALREDLVAVLESLLDSASGSNAVDGQFIVNVSPELHAVLIDALAHSELAGPPMRWQLTAAQPADLSRLLALSTLDLLQSPHLSLLRRCAGPGCGWMFLDRTRSHTRRWCNTTDCGNRDRARRHYARQRQQQPGTVTKPS